MRLDWSYSHNNEQQQTTECTRDTRAVVVKPRPTTRTMQTNDERWCDVMGVVMMVGEGDDEQEEEEGSCLSKAMTGLNFVPLSCLSNPVPVTHPTYIAWKHFA
jgi:hypothetical protein